MSSEPIPYGIDGERLSPYAGLFSPAGAPLPEIQLEWLDRHKGRDDVMATLAFDTMAPFDGAVVICPRCLMWWTWRTRYGADYLTVLEALARDLNWNVVYNGPLSPDQIADVIRSIRPTLFHPAWDEASLDPYSYLRTVWNVADACGVPARNVLLSRDTLVGTYGRLLASV